MSLRRLVLPVTLLSVMLAGRPSPVHAATPFSQAKNLKVELKRIKTDLGHSSIKGPVEVLRDYAKEASRLNGVRHGVVVKYEPWYGKIVVTPKGNVKFLREGETVASNITVANLHKMGLDHGTLMTAIRRTRKQLDTDKKAWTVPSELVTSTLYDRYAH